MIPVSASNFARRRPIRLRVAAQLLRWRRVRSAEISGDTVAEDSASTAGTCAVEPAAAAAANEDSCFATSGSAV